MLFQNSPLAFRQDIFQRAIRRLPQLFLPLLLMLCSTLVGSCTANEQWQDSAMGSHLGSEMLELTTSSQSQAVRICADGETVRGIDVSKWQGEVNWQQVSQDGIDFAFIRVSDGLNFVDAQFDRNWREAKANGVQRGAYQFFRQDLDVIAQADLLLDMMGELQIGDLPPVIDVESTDGQDAATIVANVQAWVDHVEAATGVKPIIYTGRYFWNDNVGGSDAFVAHPLWVPNYGVTCPQTPEAWGQWSFWQDTSSGSVAGVDGNTDMNFFNGAAAALQELAVGDPECGDGLCFGGETHDDCPADCLICENIPAQGGIVDDGDLCFSTGGSPE
ncbi:MAG: hypothetical protein GY822_13205 [Deltaproteobacteria bacterium]|nr:hypothetical protein [Deltaproteobacteria bacterium]